MFLIIIFKCLDHFSVAFFIVRNKISYCTRYISIANVICCSKLSLLFDTWFGCYCDSSL